MVDVVDTKATSANVVAANGDPFQDANCVVEMAVSRNAMGERNWERCGRDGALAFMNELTYWTVLQNQPGGARVTLELALKGLPQDYVCACGCGCEAIRLSATCAFCESCAAGTHRPQSPPPSPRRETAADAAAVEAAMRVAGHKRARPLSRPTI